MTSLSSYGNVVTKSGSYTMYPAIYTGILQSGGSSATFQNGVTASVSFAPALVSTVCPYTVTSAQNSDVTVNIDNSLVGLLSGSSLTADGGSITVGGTTSISALNGMDFNIKNGGYLSLENIHGSDLSVLSNANITFASGGGTLVLNPDSSVNILSFDNLNGFDQEGTSIEIPGASYVYSATYDGRDTYITTDTDVTVKLNGNYTRENNSLYQSSQYGNLYISPTYYNNTHYDGTIVCFLPGTMIKSKSKYIPVEHIHVGDDIITYVDGVEITRHVTWVGKAHCNVRSHLPNDEAGYPVRVLKDAIAPNIPFKDLLITPEHCLFLDGHFIPIRMLVNNCSIFYDKRITSYDYYHIETQDHSIIMADGALTESYLDTGNRHAFLEQNANTSLVLD